MSIAMSVAFRGARRSIAFALSSGAFRAIACLVAILLVGATAATARADDPSIYVEANQYDGNSWAIDGWVFADDCEDLPVTITLPSGATATVYTDETGYFLYFVNLNPSPGDGISASVTDDTSATATANFPL
jgi:phosphatidate phosphatase APP1